MNEVSFLARLESFAESSPITFAILFIVLVFGFVSLLIVLTYWFAPQVYARWLPRVLALSEHVPIVHVLFGTPGIHYYQFLQMQRAYFDGRIARALALSERMMSWPEGSSWAIVNWRICLLVSAGRYRDALRAPQSYDQPALQADRALHPRVYLLSRINIAEALYNLGRLGCAARVLEEVRIESKGADEDLLSAGLATQSAWLFTMMGQPKRALLRLENVTIDDFPEPFRAEWYFTRAAALRDLKSLKDAQQEAEEGMRRSVRASSKRNALFLMAGIARGQGKFSEAIAMLEQGVAHRYIGQGGDGLLLLGDLYAQAGRSVEALRAFELAIERDPESRSARVARSRSRSLRAGSLP